MNAILTKLRKLSSFNVNVFTFENAANARRERANTESTLTATKTFVGFRRKANTLAMENWEQVPITRTSLEALDCEEYKKYDMFPSFFTLDDASIFEAKDRCQ